MATSIKRRRSSSVGVDESNNTSRRLRRTADVVAGGSPLDDSVGLRDLLDFGPLAGPADISRRFEQIASALLNDFRIILKAGETQSEYEILELEFYLQKSVVHEDPFTHGSDEQKQSGRWYFHRVPRKSTNANHGVTAAGGYRGGTRKGLDLTLGQSAAELSPYFANPSLPTMENTIQPPLLRGGALFRTLRRVSDAKVISGPSLLVDEILAQSHASSVAQLVKDKWDGDITAFPSSSSSSSLASRSTAMYLARVQQPAVRTPPRIYRSPRIGLDLSHPDLAKDPSLAHPRVIYVSRPYRYFVHPHLLTANGRAQTFLGVYDACLADSLEIDKEHDNFVSELVGRTALKELTVRRYLEEMEYGKKGALKTFTGAAGKGASASPTTFLRMMATLRRLQGSA